MLVDDITIKVQAGKGGKGAVAFNKNKMSLGPAGGSGGAGGSVYFEGASDLSLLKQFRFKKDVWARDGEDGKSQFRDGIDGGDLIFKVPVGTVIHNLTQKNTTEIVKIGERILAVKGGMGGKGNYLFRSPKNTSPRRFQPGTPGEAASIRLELKLIADVGFVGLPNVGKSSLLNELTNAQSKVANYPFTTLEPSLGVYCDLVLADIPGLIEGASEGKGLGIKFLRHVERTNSVFHFIAADSEDPKEDYAVVRRELKAYNKELLKRPEYIIVSKIDMVDFAKKKELMKMFKKSHDTVLAISIHDEDSLQDVHKLLNTIMKEKRVESSDE